MTSERSEAGEKLPINTINTSSVNGVSVGEQINELVKLIEKSNQKSTELQEQVEKLQQESDILKQESKKSKQESEKSKQESVLSNQKSTELQKQVDKLQQESDKLSKQVEEMNQERTLEGTTQKILYFLLF